MHSINASLEKITSGNLDEKVSVYTNEEFSLLSDDINNTVSTLKHYIKEAEERIDRELELARQIQHSALPSVFPPYPNRLDFEIFADMHTAKEVGGDFYDFYLLGEDKLTFLIADVSDKGIPAAMFALMCFLPRFILMVTGKSELLNDHYGVSYSDLGAAAYIIYNLLSRAKAQTSEPEE